MDKYDVFISCKSEDYKFAEEIYDFLNSHGIYTFLASKELRRLGESEYRRAISKALRDACHLIVFASNPEYIESTWVEYEWDMFVNAKLKGKKSGNIITILKDVSTDDIPMDLWKYESFSFENFRDRIIQYVETPDSIARRSEKERLKEEALRKEREAEAKAAKRKDLKKKLTDTAEEYKKAVAALQVDIDKINSLLEELDITSRQCPICGTATPIEAEVCPTCGWPISPLEGLPDLEYLNNDSVTLQHTFSGIYKEYLDLKQSSGTSPADKKRIAELESTIALQRDEISGLKILSASSSQNESKTQRHEGEYTVWVKFCPGRAEKIIAEFISDSELHEFRTSMDAKRPYSLAAFSAEPDARALKVLLEGMGATVEVRKNEETAHNQTPFKTPDSAHASQSDNKSHDKPTGLQINRCNGNIDKVAELMASYFGRSKSSFKSVLQTLPYSTPCCLTKEEAIELSWKLNQLGVNSRLI